jgi:hypothetical protein
MIIRLPFSLSLSPLSWGGKILIFDKDFFYQFFSAMVPLQCLVTAILNVTLLRFISGGHCYFEM